MPENNEVIVLEDVSKYYGSVPVLRELNLIIRRGERVVILGPSGSGKSTVVRCVSGLVIPDKGQVLIEGLDIRCPKNLAKVRQQVGVGMVFQQFNLYPHMSVLNNCTLALQLVKKMKPEQAKKVAMHYLNKVHMGSHVDKWPAQLSGGQQQRLAIARALCMNPSIMLFDEPTSSLDPEMVKEVFDVMISLASEDKTIVCVTHSMSFARQFAHRVIFIDQGEILEEASPDVFFKSPKTRRAKDFLKKILSYESAH